MLFQNRNIDSHHIELPFRFWCAVFHIPHCVVDWRVEGSGGSEWRPLNLAEVLPPSGQGGGYPQASQRA